jgi:hypothetical protein
MNRYVPAHRVVGESFGPKGLAQEENVNAAAVGGTIIAALVAPPYDWPWWACVIVGLGASADIGALQGTLITRLHLPSFVVTLGGLLFWSGLLIYIFDLDKNSVGGVLTIINPVLYNLVNGNMTPIAGWGLPCRACLGSSRSSLPSSWRGPGFSPEPAWAVTSTRSEPVRRRLAGPASTWPGSAPLPSRSSG